MNLKIEKLLNDNLTEFEISKTIREYIKNYFSSLDRIFEKSQGKEFLVKHTKYIDSIIIAIYKVAVRKMFGLYTPMSNSIPITLIALGSYGREQMAPYSDIDLMIVYEEIEGYNTKALIEKILYIIWDTKLKLGHRVHNINELIKVSRKDDTIKTALLESRFICGSKYLWIKTENLLNKIRKDRQKEFIFKKIKEAKKRREKYPISMQPNIKEGVGSLRDANLLYWIANALFGVNRLKDLTNKIFNDEEYREFRLALEWLFKIRVALHLVANKKEDRLLFQYILDVAKKLNIKGNKKEQILVTKTLQSLHTIDIFTKIFTKKMTKEFLYNPKNIPLLKQKRVEKNIYQCNNTIFSSFFIKDSSLKEFLKLLNRVNFSEYDPSFIYFAKNIKYPNRLNKELKSLIKNLFFKENLYPILKLLYDSNLLPIIIPPLKKVMFLPQFDGYHQFPVDLHSIYAIKNLENIKDSFIKKLYDTLPLDLKAILKLATLMHDSGKGRREQHSKVGKRLFIDFAKKLGFNKELIDIGATLIEHHIAMSNTAFREDIYSEKTLLYFMAKIKNKTNLDLLYILTYADINAVGENVWNSYNASLLKELYLQTKSGFDKKEVLGEIQKRLKKEESLKRNKRFLSLSKSMQKSILSIESNLFFIKHTSNEIIDISLLANKIEDFEFIIENKDFLSIKILRKKPLNLGYLLGKLSFMDIASMDIYKLFKDMKYFVINFRQKSEYIPLFENIIKNSFDMSKRVRLKSLEINKDEIKIDCNHSKTYASIFLNSKNQKGLLAFIATLFDKYSIDIATAKAYTMKNRARDMFLIEKNGNFCNNKEKIIDILTKGNL